MYIRYIISLLLLFTGITFSGSVSAQNQKMDRQEWFKQMRVYKHDFLTKELNLSPEQQQSFFKLYDAMDENLMKTQHDCRVYERKISQSNTHISDLEYEKATEAVLDTRMREAQIAREYYDKFKSVLSSEQLYKLTQAERKFTREVLKQHNRMKQQKKNNRD